MATLQFLNAKDVELEEAICKAVRDRGKHPKIQVVVRGGYVHLLGGVDSVDEKKEIDGMVEAIPGVQMVTNHIHVQPREEKRNFTHF
jgi:osmotically-inducible protein OsmY